MILSGQTIRRLNLLEPCVDAGTFAGTSHGLGPAGYDLRLVLPKEGCWEGTQGRITYLQPGEFLLAATQERFDMPNDLVGIVHDKSTWARRGLSVFNTIIEPGWRGWLTLELVNHGKELLELTEGQGIAQVVFHRTDEPVEQPYPADGKYQDAGYGPQAARS